MNGRERTSVAMRGGVPDRVPVMCQLALGHYFLNTPIPPHRIWFTSEGFAEALVNLQRRYHFDGILINLPGRAPNTLDHLLRVERTPEGERLSWRNGQLTVFPNDDNPCHYQVHGQPLPRASFAELDPDQPAALDACTGYWWNTCHEPQVLGKTLPGLLTAVPDYFLQTIRLVRAETHDEVSVHGEVFSPFTHLLELFGYEQALLGLAEDPARAHAWLERLTECCVRWAVAQARAGVDAVLISSAFAGGGFISRAAYANFVLPYEQRLARAVRAAQVPVYTHTCGRIGDRLELMAETEINGLDTLDPPPLGNTDLGEAKRLVGQHVFLKGNMNPVALLNASSETEIRTEALRCLRQGMAGGGYILSTACSVAPRVEPWKLELLVPLAEELGRYGSPAPGSGPAPIPH
jgi:hypothetical protein